MSLSPLPSINLAAVIDHTWLPELPWQATADDTAQQLQTLCDTAKTYEFAAVCVRPEHVALCAQYLIGSPVKLAAVVGFPAQKVALTDEQLTPTIGNAPLTSKLAEIKDVITDGATELDVVWDVATFLRGFRTGNTTETAAELAAYKQTAGNTPIKLIIESDLLPTEALAVATQLCQHTGMAMVKTSTGYVQGGVGATELTIQAVRHALGDAYPETVGIKASGGIRTPAQAQAMINAGATRLGTSNGVALIGEEPAITAGSY